MAKRKFAISEDDIMDLQKEKVQETTVKKSNMNPASLANLRPRSPGKREKKYIQLDIWEHEDYLNRMSKYNKMTRTKYIQTLIHNDYEAHKDEYKLLKELKAYDSKK